MRLWHKDLIPYLPRKQLVSQWRECCAIAANIKKYGTPNHILVNKIIDYDYGEQHFVNYCSLVYNEMHKRGYKADWEKLNKNLTMSYQPKETLSPIEYARLFCFWHDACYLRQCYFNLEEKWMCGGILDEEWKIIYDRFIKQIWGC